VPRCGVGVTDRFVDLCIVERARDRSSAIQ
jgi:hypothetical protein